MSLYVTEKSLNVFLVLTFDTKVLTWCFLCAIIWHRKWGVSHESYRQTHIYPGRLQWHFGVVWESIKFIDICSHSSPETHCSVRNRRCFVHDRFIRKRIETCEIENPKEGPHAWLVTGAEPEQPIQAKREPSVPKAAQSAPVQEQNPKPSFDGDDLLSSLL